LGAEFRWHLDKNSDAALSVTIRASGDAKGAAFALQVKALAATMMSSRFGFEARPFFPLKVRPPGMGQLLMKLSPGPIPNGQFQSQPEDLIS
jgi:LDH2 family malate/lactate/ureidoglycolate dehydrogenase